MTADSQFRKDTNFCTQNSDCFVLLKLSNRKRQNRFLTNSCIVGLTVGGSRGQRKFSPERDFLNVMVIHTDRCREPQPEGKSRRLLGLADEWVGTHC